MITLATLPMATAQQVLDQGVQHLLTQKAKCLNGRGGCAYHRADGLRCGAGIFISKEEWDYGMEGKGWITLYERGAVPKEYRGLISDIQFIHDRRPVCEWPDALAILAREHQLSFNPPIPA